MRRGPGAAAHWASGAAGDPSVGFTARELETHLRTEFSTYSWLLDAMLAHTGFEVLDRSLCLPRNAT